MRLRTPLFLLHAPWAIEFLPKSKTPLIELVRRRRSGGAMCILRPVGLLA